MAEFLTVKEAGSLVNKSPSSIRRIIYPILEDDHHPDRHHIQPSADEVMTLRMKGEGFAWKLSEELLRREVPYEPESEKGNEAGTSRGSSQEGGELLSMLRRELDIKNQQITQQAALLGQQLELISGLSERLREGNILIGGLQKQLSLTDGREKPVSDAVVTPPPAAKPTPQKGSKPSSKAVQNPKGVFSRIFGRR